MKLSFKTFKKRCQNKMKQNHRVWRNFSSKWCLRVSQGRSQSLLRQSPGSLKASPGSLCASCLAPPGTPCEPLAPSRYCLGASKSYLGSLGTKHVVLGGFGTPNFIQNQEFVSHAFNIYYPYSPSSTASETSG